MSHMCLRKKLVFQMNIIWTMVHAEMFWSPFIDGCAILILESRYGLYVDPPDEGPRSLPVAWPILGPIHAFSACPPRISDLIPFKISPGPVIRVWVDVSNQTNEYFGLDPYNPTNHFVWKQTKAQLAFNKNTATIKPIMGWTMAWPL